jgi:hypothetical protein
LSVSIQCQSSDPWAATGPTNAEFEFWRGRKRARATTSPNSGLGGVASPTSYNKATTTTILYDVTIFFS